MRPLPRAPHPAPWPCSQGHRPISTRAIILNTSNTPAIVRALDQSATFTGRGGRRRHTRHRGRFLGWPPLVSNNTHPRARKSSGRLLGHHHSLPLSPSPSRASARKAVSAVSCLPLAGASDRSNDSLLAAVRSPPPHFFSSPQRSGLLPSARGRPTDRLESPSQGSLAPPLVFLSPDVDDSCYATRPHLPVVSTRVWAFLSQQATRPLD